MSGVRPCANLRRTRRKRLIGNQPTASGVKFLMKEVDVPCKAGARPPAEGFASSQSEVIAQKESQCIAQPTTTTN